MPWENVMTTEDAEFALEVVQFCREHPDQFDQSQWVCNTTACYGGHIGLQRGWEPFPDWRDGDPDGEYHTSRMRRRATGDVTDVETVVQMELGITEYQAGRLCAGGQTLEDVERLVRMWSWSPPTALGD